MVLRKITRKMKEFKTRSCKGKKKYNLLIALWKCFILKQKNVYVQHYKCYFGNHFHIGHSNKSTEQKVKYFMPRAKLSLLYH